MDPHQRLLLEACYEALAVCGHTKASLMGSDIGVFLGFVTSSEWGLRQVMAANSSQLL